MPWNSSLNKLFLRLQYTFFRQIHSQYDLYYQSLHYTLKFNETSANNRLLHLNVKKLSSRDVPVCS